MDNTALQRIRDIISQSQQVTVAVSQNPSVDQMAAALSLYLTLEAQGKKVTVVSPTEPIVELSSLVGIDKVKTSNQGTAGDLIVSFPYREGEIEKVSYTIDDGFLNIVVKAGESGLTFTEQDVIFKRGSDKPELLLSVGVEQLSQIEGMFPEGSLMDATIINIDNSDNNEGYGTMVLVSSKFSSLSEQVADLVLNLGYEIDIDAAQNLLSGISTATENFQSPQTSYLAFEIAGILMKRGAVRVRPVREPRQTPAHMQPQPRVQQPQQQPQRRDDRQDRREAIREALRSQSQQRQQNQRQNERPTERPEKGQQPQQQRQQTDQKPPSDWLTPKVYKGSTAV